MRYFKRYWKDVRGDAHNDWGCSWWYFETDNQGNVLRQLEIYDSGPTHRYSDSHFEDDFGGLTDQPLTLLEFVPFEIVKDEFERAWGLQS